MYVLSWAIRPWIGKSKAFTMTLRSADVYGIFMFKTFCSFYLDTSELLESCILRHISSDSLKTKPPCRNKQQKWGLYEKLCVVCMLFIITWLWAEPFRLGTSCRNLKNWSFDIDDWTVQARRHTRNVEGEIESMHTHGVSIPTWILSKRSWEIWHESDDKGAGSEYRSGPQKFFFLGGV